MATKNKVYHQLPHRLWMKVSLTILVPYLSNMYTANCQYIRVATEMAKANTNTCSPHLCSEARGWAPCTRWAPGRGS